MKPKPKADTATKVTLWDRFWFQPASVGRISMIRVMLCGITILYFLSCWSDLTFWYTTDGVFAPDRSSRFWDTAGLGGEARWNLSPLFLSDQVWVYRIYLVAGIGLAIAAACGVGGRATALLLWLFLVGWANRAMILSGLTESLLSLALLPAAIAPPVKAWQTADNAGHRHWTARLATRLIAVQITLIGILTVAAMLGGRVWFNGSGAFALAAPWQDRTINWAGENSMFVSPPIHEITTHLIVLTLPTALLLSWIPATSRYGKSAIIAWCLVVAALGSVWLYAATFAVMALAIEPMPGRLNYADAPASTSVR